MNFAKVPAATLIRAAKAGVGISVRSALVEGHDPESIRRQVIERYRREIEAASFGASLDSMLMDAVGDAIDAVLDEPLAAKPAKLAVDAARTASDRGEVRGLGAVWATRSR